MAAKTHSAYGPWLAYMMDIKRVDTDKLAKKTGISRQRIDELIHGVLPAEEARADLMKIGVVLLDADPKVRMERVIKALNVSADLRNWSQSCDGGCCSWNIVTEIAVDPAIKAIESFK